MSTVSAISFRLAAHPEERRALLKLRTHVYRQVGKHLRPGEMVDRFDTDAILVGVWRGDRPIATARVLWQAPEAEWEHDRFIQWDDRFPPRAQSCEISRFCIDRPERSWTVIRTLCHGVLEAMMRTGRPNFIACCTDELSFFYQHFFGAKFVGESFTHDDLGSKPHRMFRCAYQQGLVGRGIGTIPWLVLWPTATLKTWARFPHSQRDITTGHRIALHAASALEPFAASLFDVFRRGRMRR